MNEPTTAIFTAERPHWPKHASVAQVAMCGDAHAACMYSALPAPARAYGVGETLAIPSAEQPLPIQMLVADPARPSGCRYWTTIQSLVFQGTLPSSGSWTTRAAKTGDEMYRTCGACAHCFRVQALSGIVA
jgi:hypothetical protein